MARTVIVLVSFIVFYVGMGVACSATPIVRFFAVEGVAVVDDLVGEDETGETLAAFGLEGVDLEIVLEADLAGEGGGLAGAVGGAGDAGGEREQEEEEQGQEEGSGGRGHGWVGWWG